MSRTIVEDFHREFQLAYRQQLLQHDQITREFFSRIGSLCEQVPDNSRTIARAMRDLPLPSDLFPDSGHKTSQQAIDSTCVDSDAFGQTAGDSGKLNPERRVDPTTPELFSNIADQNGGQPGTSVEPPSLSDGVDLQVFGEATKLDAGRDEAGDVCLADAADKLLDNDGSLARAKSYQGETLIATLSFMNEDGEVVEHSGAFERILGPRYTAFKRKFKLAFCRGEPMDGLLASIIGSGCFKLLSALVIVSNYIFIMMQCDYRMSHLNEDETGPMITVGYCFTGFYTFELCCLLIVRRREFFLGPEVGWNIFDALIVFVAWIELGFKMAGGPTINASFLRVLRFFKISRVLRMFSAMRMFKEIRIMVDALAGCAVLFVFCTLMLAIFISIFAIFFVQGAAGFLESNPDANPDEVTMLKEHYSTVADAMLALFMTCTGGDDWSTYFNAIKPVHWIYSYLFLAFVVAYYIAFFNVVTSVFCEKAISLASPTTTELMGKRMEQEQKDAKELLALLKRFVVEDGSHNITADQFDSFVRHPEVELYFQVRGCSATSAHKFFDMLCDIRNTDKVDFATFISALVKLDGSASSIDTHCLSIRQKHELDKLAVMQEFQQQEFAWLRRELQNMAAANVALSSQTRSIEKWTTEKVGAKDFNLTFPSTRSNLSVTSSGSRAWV